jgi:hypothetical protein
MVLALNFQNPKKKICPTDRPSDFMWFRSALHPEVKSDNLQLPTEFSVLHVRHSLSFAMKNAMRQESRCSRALARSPGVGLKERHSREVKKQR